MFKVKFLALLNLIQKICLQLTVSIWRLNLIKFGNHMLLFATSKDGRQRAANLIEHSIP